MMHKHFVAVICTICTSGLIAAMPRSADMDNAELSNSYEDGSKFSLEILQPTCRKNAACRISGYEDLSMAFCECPQHQHCGASPPVLVSGTDYYLCGPHKTPICKSGQTATIVEGLQTQVLCSCRRRLVRALVQKNYAEFTCGHARSKIWIKKMHGSGGHDQTERYVLN